MPPSADPETDDPTQETHETTRHGTTTWITGIHLRLITHDVDGPRLDVTAATDLRDRIDTAIGVMRQRTAG